MKTSEQIYYDMLNATKKERAFLEECLMILECVKHSWINDSYNNTKHTIDILLKRRKTYPDEYQYKPELKELRRKLKGLKYILDEKPIRRRNKPFKVEVGK